MLVAGSGIVVLSSLSLFLYIGFFIMGAGLGFYEVSGNAIIPEMYLDHKESSRFLLLAGFCHSLGAMISPAVSGKLLSIDINWRMLYIGCAAFAVALFVYLVLNIPKDHYNKREETAGCAYFLKLFFGDGMPIYCIGIAIYVSLEIGIASWMLTYGSEVKGLQPETAAVFQSVFFGCIMTGRFLGSFFTKITGSLLGMISQSLIAGGLLVLGIYGSPSLFIAIPIAGFFISTLFPAICARVSRESREMTAKRFGILFTFAGIGGMLGPSAIGIFADLSTLQGGMNVILVFVGLMVMTFVLLFLHNNGKKSVRENL